MAAPINKAKFTQDINAPIKAVYGGGLMFNKDNLSNVISVDITESGQPFEVTGTVAGTVIRSDGTTVPVNTGAISGNTVSLTLTEACFDVPGQIVVNIIVTNGDVKCCVLRAVYTVVPTETSAVVDPGDILPSIADLINDIDAAVASIPADYSGLLASIAGTFSASTAYAAGAYVWYDGTLYRFTAAHAAGSWTGSDATTVTIGGELADLKSALTKTEIDISRLFIFEQPSITAEMGLLPLHVETGDSITIKRVDGEPFDQADQIKFYDKNGNYITYWGTPKDWVERTFTYSDQETAEYIGLYLISSNSPELCVTNNSSKSLLLAEVKDRKNQDNALNNSIGELSDAITNTNDDIEHIIKGRRPYDLISNYYWMYNGLPGAYNGWSRTGFIPCDPGSTIYIYSPLRSTYNVFFKTATEGDLSVIEATFTVNEGLNEIAVPSDAHFFGLSNTTEAMSGTYVKSLVTYEEFVNAEKEVDESSVTALNPRQTVGQRIIQAARRANIWNTTPQPPDPLVLSVLTDLHGSKTNLERFISFTQSYSSYVDDMLSLGDMVAAKYSDDYTYWLNTQGADEILLTIGNHDVWLTGLSGSELASKTDVYAKFFAPKISTWGNGIVQPTNAQAEGLMYWYKDYTAKGVRLIVLDCMYWTEAQNAWFVDVLSDARTNNLHVIAVQHYNPTKSLAEIDCNFYSLDYGFNNLVQSTGAAQMLADVDDFIAAGGVFVCWLSGDAHYDAFGVYTAQSGNKQLCLTFENAGISSLWGDANRIVGQKSQDSFNIVSADTYSKLVKVVRVGNNMDRYMRRKDCICWDYQNHRMIAAE